MVRKSDLQANLQPNIECKQNVFNLSVSYADSSLYQREPCTVDCLHLINESLAIHSAYNTDLQLNKCTKESLFY